MAEIKNVMPIDINADADEEDEEGIVDSFRPELTPVGRANPIFDDAL